MELTSQFILASIQKDLNVDSSLEFIHVGATGKLPNQEAG